MDNRPRPPALKGKVSKVVEKPEGVLVVVDTPLGPAHVLFDADVFRNLWRERDGRVVGHDVEVHGKAPRQKIKFV